MLHSSKTILEMNNMEKTVYNTFFSPDVEGTLFTKEQIKEITDSISQKISDSFKKQLDKAFKEYNEGKKIATDTPKRRKH